MRNGNFSRLAIASSYGSAFGSVDIRPKPGRVLKAHGARQLAANVPWPFSHQAIPERQNFNAILALLIFVRDECR
jgi:hypothetical protein